MQGSGGDPAATSLRQHAARPARCRAAAAARTRAMHTASITAGSPEVHAGRQAGAADGAWHCGRRWGLQGVGLGCRAHAATRSRWPCETMQRSAAGASSGACCTRMNHKSSSLQRLAAGARSRCMPHRFNSPGLSVWLVSSTGFPSFTTGSPVLVRCGVKESKEGNVLVHCGTDTCAKHWPGLCCGACPL